MIFKIGNKSYQKIEKIADFGLACSIVDADTKGHDKHDAIPDIRSTSKNFQSLQEIKLVRGGANVVLNQALSTCSYATHPLHFSLL